LVVVTLVVAASLAPCSHTGPSAPDGLFFPTIPRQDAYPAALLVGPLAERSGCLVVGEKGFNGLLLWPDGYTARTGQDGRTQVLDEKGTVVATVGEKMSLGGGYVGASFDTLTSQRTPDACGHHRWQYWLVAPS
jgi:hypothetical protein